MNNPVPNTIYNVLMNHHWKKLSQKPKITLIGILKKIDVIFRANKNLKRYFWFLGILLSNIIMIIILT